MSKLVGVCFKDKGKIYYFNSNNLKLEDNDSVIVETDRGLQYAKVINIKEAEDTSSLNCFKNVIRKANKDDYINNKKNIIDAVKALNKAKKISEKLKLNMNFTEASYTLNRSQLIFYFISDVRVDFRDLARELASIYKTRIELRQIGVRDKAKEISGIGMCGRELCCARFLSDLDSVTINMAKNQNISLNPNKINGLCGRLLCCLKYEDEMYTENREDMPNIGDIVATDLGDGVVRSIDIPRRKFIVDVEDEGKVEISLLNNRCDSCGKCSK